MTQQVISEIEVKARIACLMEQRNEHADRIVIMAGQRTLLAARIAELEEKVKELEAKAITPVPVAPARRKRRV